MKEKKGILTVVAICLLGFFIVRATVDNSNVNHSPESEPRRVGLPNITKTYSELEKCSIDQIVDDDELIYVLYGEHEGNVQVFNHYGEHLYSAYFATHMNGAFSIAVADGNLYVRDERHNLYVLKNGKLLDFYYSDSAEHIMRTLDFSMSSTKFRVRFGSIWRVDGNDSVCVVARSPIAALQQGNLMFYASLFVAAIIGVLKYKRTKS